MTVFEPAGGGLPPALPPFVPPAAIVVTTDTPCRRCQYDLRGLPAEGRCPECGAAVGLSTQGDLLRYCDPAWVGTLRTGVLCMLWAVAVLIVGGILGGVVAAALHNRYVSVVVQTGGSLLSLVGAWLLTTPDPSGLGEDRYGTSRKLIRVTLVFGLVQQAVAFAQQGGAVPPALNLALGLLAGIAALVSLVGTFATLVYLGKLARRIPDATLADRARLLMYGIGIPAGVLALGLIGVSVAAAVGRGAGGGPGLPAGIAAFGCVAGLAGIALIVFGIMYLIMLVRFGNALSQQAAFARQTWAVTAPVGPALP